MEKEMPRPGGEPGGGADAGIGGVRCKKLAADEIADGCLNAAAFERVLLLGDCAGVPPEFQAEERFFQLLEVHPSGGRGAAGVFDSGSDRRGVCRLRMGGALSGMIAGAGLFPSGDRRRGGGESPIRSYGDGALLAHQEEKAAEEEQTHAAEDDPLETADARRKHLYVFSSRGASTAACTLPALGRLALRLCLGLDGSGAGEGDSEIGSSGEVFAREEGEPLIVTGRIETVGGDLDAYGSGEHG